MTIVIKNVKKLRDGSFGEMSHTSKNKIEIVISTDKNKTVAEYGSTLLHELLHAWLEILRLVGAEVGKRKEHQFIYAVEDVVIKLMKKYIGAYHEKAK